MAAPRSTRRSCACARVSGGAASGVGELGRFFFESSLQGKHHLMHAGCGGYAREVLSVTGISSVFVKIIASEFSFPSKSATCSNSAIQKSSMANGSDQKLVMAFISRTAHLPRHLFPIQITETKRGKRKAGLLCIHSFSPRCIKEMHTKVLLICGTPTQQHYLPTLWDPGNSPAKPS